MCIWEKMADMHSKMYACFVDYDEAFGKVQKADAIVCKQSPGFKRYLYIWNLVLETKPCNETWKLADIKHRSTKRKTMTMYTLTIAFQFVSKAIFWEALTYANDGLIVSGEVNNIMQYEDNVEL